MKTAFLAIDIVSDFVTPLLNGVLEGEIFLLQKPDEYRNKEYVVINSLPVPSGVLQSVTVNINIHVEDLQPGKIDIVRLEQLTSPILTALENDHTIDNASIVLFDQAVQRNEVASESYSNIRVRVSMLNE